MEIQLQTELFQAMGKPDFYPHRVSVIEQRETHISKVFLSGDYVYKIKKPVYFEYFKKKYKPFNKVGDAIHISVNTEKTLEKCMQQILGTDYIVALGS